MLAGGFPNERIWEWDGASWSSTTLSLPFQRYANPSRAVPFALDLTSASTPIGGGCTVWLGGGFVGLFQISDTFGFASQPLPLPANPALRGLDLFAQAAVLEPASINGLVLTQGLRLTLGD